MKENLVIVESPTKAKTINKILGEDFVVFSCMGHIIDLPEKELGVDIKNNFRPYYVVMPQRRKIVTQLKKEAKGKKNIYVATDPDREGEAIGWHIKEKIFKDRSIFRVTFHEITEEKIKEAFSNLRDFDLNMVEAQISRRILDRIVGYFLSPLLWKKVASGLSAGRVQSVALRLIVEREREIQNFVPQEYWQIDAEFKKVDSEESFSAKLEKIDSKKPQIRNKEEADNLIQDIKNKNFKVLHIKITERKRFPEPPFITSTLQQEAFNKLGFSATKTMIIAQELYEGVDIGRKNPIGLITYMRTDSVRVNVEALSRLRQYIKENFGENYLPSQPYEYKAKKLAQQAHEAIRPTDINLKPELIKGYLSPDQYNLYKLIYNRFLASQMLPALYRITSVEIISEDKKYLFSASESQLIFDGFLKVYDREEEKQEEKKLPSLKEEETLEIKEITSSQHFTKPPSRYTDSSLVKTLEEEGIGRPSTYAPIIHTLILRGYVRRYKKQFYPTELGIKVCELLVKYFPKIMNLKFTAEMESKLDEIEEGKTNRLIILNEFYQSFKEDFEFAKENIKKEIITTDKICEKCNSPMIIKWSRKGKFLSCSSFPKCKNAKPLTTGIKCPQSGCNGELVERRGKRGIFFGCTNYPRCKFTAKDLSLNQDAK